MASYQDREHFIPLRRHELVRLLCDQLSPAESAEFRKFCGKLCDRVHLEFYRLLERLKEDYAPFDPDADTHALNAVEGAERTDKAERLFVDADRLLTRANYVQLSREQVLAAQQGASSWGLDMSIELDAFSRFALYTRGKVTGERVLRSWRTWFRAKSIRVEIYQRLVLVLQQKKHWRLGKSPDTRSIFLKLFKEIPTADLEMLIPGGRLQMPKFERGKLGFSIISGLAVLLWQFIQNFFLIAKAATAGAITYGPLGIIAAMFGYGYRQYYGYQFSLRTYNLKLAQSLYYQNLDNNGGVLFRLLDSAEEQECRETILGYYYLLRLAGTDGMTAGALDDAIEEALEKTTGVKIDFEIDDAMKKVEAIGLARLIGDRYHPIPISAALAKLDALPATAVFTREMMPNVDRPLVVGAGQSHRNVRCA
ncbi:MAG: DUF3754 domain-containing protein [Gemmataceae bacterium]